MSGVFGTTAAHAFPGDEKVFPASMCIRTSGGSPFYENNGRLFNNTPISSLMRVVCPLVRDDVLGNWDTVQVTVIDQHLSEAVKCRVGNLVDSAGGTIKLTSVKETVGNSSSGQNLLFTPEATLRREYDWLTQRLRATEAALKRSASLNAQSGTPSNTAEAGADTPTGTDNELSEEEQITELSEEEQIMATLDELDLRLDQEPEDPTWSQSTEMEVTAFLHSDGMEGSHVLSADCQSSLCRVEVAHEDASAQGWLIDHLPMEPPFDGEMLIRQVDADSTAPRTLVYLSRPGQPLLSAIP